MIAPALLALVFAAEPLSLSVSELHVVDLPKERGAFFAEHLAQKLGEQGAKVSSPAQLSQLLGAERQKQLMGCDDASGACLAEIASALGSDGLVFGDIARIGKVVQVNLKVIGGRDGARLASFSARVEAEEQVLDLLDDAARSLFSQTRSSLSGGLTARKLAWLPLAVGGAVTAGGAIALVLARSTYASIPQSPGQGTLTEDELRTRVSTGTTQQTLGWVLVGAGAATVAAGALMAVFGGPSASTSTQIAVMPTSSGFSVSLGGSF